MGYNPDLWTRLEYDQIPIYFRKDKAGWFVPNDRGDKILCDIARGVSSDGNLEIRRFLERLPEEPPYSYPGRRALLRTKHLRELWFHITNRCNMTCSHCLFSASPAEKGEMSAQGILEIADEAVSLGCRVFALTGGEPFVHREFYSIAKGLLTYNGTHVVVLTNGLGLRSWLKSKPWDFDRFHLQISLDGLSDNHDRIRGVGTFDRLSSELVWLAAEGIPFTISMCVNNSNLNDMERIVDFAADMGATNFHFMWYFIRGRGRAQGFALPDQIFEHLVRAAEQAKARGLSIDNIEAFRTQVFAPSGTLHDGTTACWESASIGPDGKLYPSPALVGVESLATDLQQGLDHAWRKGPVCEQIRKASIKELSSPFRFLTGGGDTDHSYLHGGAFIGTDPYTPLYEKMVLQLIKQALPPAHSEARPCLRLKMGDILESCGAHGSVALVHSNCLLAIAQNDSLKVVKEFYSEAVGEAKAGILNPVSYSEDMLEHIPKDFRFRGYGCGSPVIDAGLIEGEHILDLGCGTGVECFIAARLLGQTGRIIGIDMLGPMLELAKEGSKAVALNLGYHNVAFSRGYLENLPLADNSLDVVLSNCVINLSVQKRLAYGEIFRVLREGGRLVISDVVCESEPDAAIRNDEALRGECIAGAMTQKDLIGTLEESGFESIELIKRFPYRIVNDHPFFSLTYVARKPIHSDRVKVMYRGPFASGVTSGGKILSLGKICELSREEAEIFGERLFVLDGQGAVTNVEMEKTCNCLVRPEATSAVSGHAPLSVPVGYEALPRFRSGCMVCGAPLSYFSEGKELECRYCKRLLRANAVCEKGHFVCDGCHSENALSVMEHVLMQTTETDMIALLAKIREHPSFPLNGPEHHALVPGIILSTYRNIGGDVTASSIQVGIRRGSQVSGGYCAFMGACGAAIGVGIALSLILEANPLKPNERQIIQSVTQGVLAEIAKLKAARCCQRDSWIALKKAAELSKPVLPMPLRAETSLVCRQQGKNTECIGAACPLFGCVKDM